MATSTPLNPAHSNHYVDYVIHYGFGTDGMPLSHSLGTVANFLDPSKATEQLERLLRKLVEVGLQTEVRQGDESSLFVFVRASKKSLTRAVHQSR